MKFVMVGHAHLDPIWLWDWREGYETLKATFRSALDRMQENPDLVYVHSSAAHYAWMEEHPALLAEIRAAVERGQWEPMGGWWVEADVNIPAGEALARQALYGQRYFEQAVGRRARVAFLPDSFGHPSTLPQLFRLSGMDCFIFLRPTEKELSLPSNLFQWEGPDGSRVLAARIECYNTNPNTVAQSLGRNLKWRPEGADEWLAFYGVGNHGGGPTKKLIQSIRDLNADPAWPAALEFGNPVDFFKRAVSDDHPIYKGGLQHTSRGCYTTHAEVKRLNRKAEQTLLTAEKFAAIATAAYGRAYPGADLTRAWQHVLFNQFHDVLCGTSIRSAYDDVRAEFGAALATGARALYGALQTIAQQVETRRSPDQPVGEVMRRVRTGDGNATADLGDGVPVVIFNPSPWPRREVVDVEVNDWAVMDLRVLDDANQPVLHQFAQPEAAKALRRRAAFLADVPPFGYRLYRLVDEAPAPVPPDAPPLTATETVLENQWWRLEFDPATGTLRRMFDLASNRELLAGAGAQLLVMDDPENPWGGDHVHSYRNLVGTFGQPKLELVESGPVRAAIRITTSFGNSTARQEISIYRESGAIHGRLQVNWQEQQKFLKLAFPLALTNPVATFSAPYGHDVRPNAGDEEPIQQWLDVSGDDYGVALINDCKYGADVAGAEIRLSLLRSSAYACAADDALPFMDQGWQELRWALLPHMGSWQQAGVVQAAHAFNEPLPFVREYAHAGTLPKRQSYLKLNPADTLVVTALKQAEDGDDLVLRLYEPHGRPAHAQVHLLGHSFAVAAGPHQIKSYRISRNGDVREVNFLEE